MRITHNMTTNKMLLNINRNVSTVDKLYNQLTTGKKIQYPSDNPIIASRALKFRTNIAETEQYRRNTAQGISWMEITEQGFSNVNKIMANIRNLCDQAANGTLDVSDRQTIAAEIQSLYEQIGNEMNVTYAGRYVFSGYRTDEPPTLTDSNKASYRITQKLGTVDIENTKAFAKTGTGIAPEVFDVARLKLAYDTVGSGTVGSTTDITFNAKAGTVVTNYPVTTVSLSTGTPTSVGPPVGPTLTDNAYTPGPNAIYYVKETGELILGSNVVTALNTTGLDGIDITYTKTNFNSGELNPRVYFDCTQLADNNGVAIPVANQKRYTMNNQELQFEFGTNTRITINNLSKDVYTAQLYADLKSLTNEIAGIHISTEAEIRARLAVTNPSFTPDQIDEAVKEQIKEENQKYSGVLHDRFSNLLGLVDTHSAKISTEYTKLGSGMNRLDLISARLEEDTVSYTKLMSDNENVDYFEVIMRLNSAESVYQAALKAGGSIMQLSLVDFIR